MDHQPVSENPCRTPADLPPEMMEKILLKLTLKDLLNTRLIWKSHDPIIKALVGKKLKPILFDVKTEEFRNHLKNNPNSPVSSELHLHLTFEDDHETIREICGNLRGKIKHLRIDMNRDYGAETDEIIVNRDRSDKLKLTGPNARLLLHILELFGEKLETLDFGLFKIGFLHALNPLLKKSSIAGNLQFPSLRKMTIFGEPSTTKKSLQTSVFHQLILKHSGKLKSLGLQIKGWKEVNILKDFKEASRLTQITSLEIPLRRMKLNLDTLLKYEDEGGLQIEELHIPDKSLKWASRNENSEKLERILKMQEKKLKILSIEQYSLDLKIPVMEQLTNLKLVAQHFPGEICFNKITPKLKSLEVEQMEAYGRGIKNGMNALFKTTNVCKSVEILKIILPKSSPKLDAGLCDILDVVFSSITSLTLGNIGEKFLQKLWTAWPNLLQLDLTLGQEFKDLDKTLFSITPEWKNNVDKKVDLWWLNNPPQVSQSICNLKKLQTLRIYRAVTPKYIGGQVESNFSEFSYFYGLKNMKQLKEFSLNQGASVAQEEEISEEARDFIRRKLPSLRINCRSEDKSV